MRVGRYISLEQIVERTKELLRHALSVLSGLALSTAHATPLVGIFSRRRPLGLP